MEHRDTQLLVVCCFLFVRCRGQWSPGTDRETNLRVNLVQGERESRRSRLSISTAPPRPSLHSAPLTPCLIINFSSSPTATSFCLPEPQRTMSRWFAIITSLSLFRTSP